MKEQVQTWICDNRQDVTRAVSTTLRAKEISFGSWFRMSEENRSPNELILYCLSKMTKTHTVILNKSFPWSTLSNYISYSDLEIMQRSSIVLVYVGVSKYAVLKPSWTVKILEPSSQTPAKNRKRKAASKTTCRSRGYHAKKETTFPSLTSGTGNVRTIRNSRTLAEKRLNQYGVGGGVQNTTRVTRKKQVDYFKLNDGLDDINNEPTSPKPKKEHNYLPSRSGPSSTRQRAQTTITSPPAQVLPSIPAVKTTQQTESNKSSTSSGIQTKPNETPEKSSTPLLVIQSTTSDIQSLPQSTPSITSTLATTSTSPFSGVQLSISGVQTLTTVSLSTLAGVHSPSSGIQTPTNSVDLNGVASNSISEISSNDKLPDLVRPNQTEADNYSLVLDTVPLVGELPPDNIFDGGTTEEEFDAVDALLGLSTVRDNSIGGNSIYQDINPVTVHLDQVSVDGAIAKIVPDEDISDAVASGELDIQPTEDDVAGVQTDRPSKDTDAELPDAEKTTVSGVQTASSGIQSEEKDHYGDETHENDNEDSKTETKTKGYIKVTTHRIRKKTNGDSRLYGCSVCGIRKRSAHNLNVHHRKRHSAQMCGVCGKVFNLASSLSHHMYTHNERRFFCEKCSFHCHFKSKLKKHNISHHSQPSHQCMQRNCGRWFKRKSDLVLHVETHKKDILECDSCDFTTTLQKYLKEHKKSHDDILLVPLQSL